MPIKVSEKVETTLVEVSAVLIAAGTSGLTVVAQLPDQYKAVGGAVCGALITAGTTLLAVWHKFVNVYDASIHQP